ncbi:hypothetical protein LTR85_009652 [Meristemomyces frigidus]|nr:hypothetical protein LTR85_009652 [Meristemomyces frigidus]
MASSEPVSMAVDGTNTATNISQLAALPEELISNITVRLDCDDLRPLRLTCKAIEAKSFHEFATEHFSGKCFMLTSESLKVLVAISNDERLRSYLRDIYIITAFFNEAAFNCPNGCRCAWQPTVRQTEAYRTYIQDQKKLAESGDDQKMLLTALRNLSGVHGIRLVDGVDSLDPTIDTAGLRKVTRGTGRPPTFAPESGRDIEYTRWHSHAWKVTLQAIAESGIDTITVLESLVSFYYNGLSVGRDFIIPTKTRNGLRNALVNLKRLRLTIRSSPLVNKNDASDSVASGKRMWQFAKVLTAPEELSLKSDFGTASGMLLHKFMQGLSLGSITKLALDMVVIDAGSLASILAPLASVKTLKLSWINLTDGTWLSILKVLQKLTTLDHLHLMWLQEGGRKAYFLTQPEHADPAADDFGWEDVDEGDADAQSDAAATDGAHDSDDDIPNLELGATFDHSTELQPDLAPASIDAVEEGAGFDDETAEDRPAFVAPGHEALPERGYYICIRGDLIEKYLPIFINEYNVGESIEDPWDGGDGPGGLNFMNALTHMLGPLPMPPPPFGAVPAGPPANGAQGGQAPAQGGPAPAQGGGGGPGHAAPPGFVTVGSGLGYQMLMGTMPMPMPLFPSATPQPAAAVPPVVQGGAQGSAAGTMGSTLPPFGSLANVFGTGSGVQTGGVGSQADGNVEFSGQTHSGTAHVVSGNGANEVEEHDEYLEKDGSEENGEFDEDGGTMLTDELD